MIIGLIGGVASGKSQVTKLLVKQTDALVLDADKIARQVMDGDEVRQLLRIAFGDVVFDAAGKLKRSELASLVFGNSAANLDNRNRLDAIVHPRVRKEIELTIEQQQAQDNRRWIVLDIPLLVEAGWSQRCDEIIFVDTPLEMRIQFARSRGWSPEELRRRESSQMPLADKKTYATVVINNNAGLDKLRSAVECFVAKSIV